MENKRKVQKPIPFPDRRRAVPETKQLMFELFVNRRDAFAEQYKNEDGRAVYAQRKSTLSVDLFQEHLEAKRTLGVYQLNFQNQLKWGCYDFDENTAADFEQAKKLYNYLKSKGLNPMMENSAGGEFKTHIWLFADTDAASMKYFMEEQAASCKVRPHEIFPKQTEIKEGDYGNLVKVPLAINLKTGQRSYLLNDKFELEPDFDAVFLFHLNNKITVPKVIIQKQTVIIGKPAESNPDSCNFLDYCLTHEIPKGKRHEIVSRNMAYYIHDKPEFDILREQYAKIQKGLPTELDNWLKGIEKGKAIPVVCGELINFQREFRIPLKCHGCKRFEDFKKQKREDDKVAKANAEKEKAKELTKQITFFFDKKNLAEQFLKVQPYFYDKGKNWWLWDRAEYKWLRVDETDLFNHIAVHSMANTIASKEKMEIIEALKQIGRKYMPREFEPTWIQFKDKIYDLENDEFFDAGPEYYATNPIPWEINGDEATPTIDKLFVDWVGAEQAPLLYEIMAYCTLSDYPIHRLFCFIGQGSNGKSTYLRLIEKFVGLSNVCSTELEALNGRFEKTRLYKKLVCMMGETNFNDINNTQWLKKLTGQDVIGIEYKGKDLIETHNYAKILIATNSLPMTSDKTQGFYRRWLIVDFPHQFPEDRDILNEIPDEEFSHLAKRCIRVLRELLVKKNFHNEGTIEDRARRFEEKSNPIAKFIKEFTDESDSDDCWISKNDFTKKLNQWLRENRMRELAENSIGKQMKALGKEEGRKYVQWYKDGMGGQIRVFFGVKWKFEENQQ